MSNEWLAAANIEQTRRLREHCNMVNLLAVANIIYATATRALQREPLKSHTAIKGEREYRNNYESRIDHHTKKKIVMIRGS